MLEKHFVDFYSPGTFFAEVTRRPLESWDVAEAVRISREIVERHAARPYGFRFVTCGREDDELDSRETAHSGMYYLGGRIRTVKQVRADAKPDEKILLSNMECNGWERIVENTNSWRWTQPFRDGDTVLDVQFYETGAPDAEGVP